MRYDRLFTKLYCTPLLLEPGVRAGFERVLHAYMTGQPVELPATAEGQPKFWGRKVDVARADKYADSVLEIDGAVATIHIDGAIDKHLTALDRICFDATDLNDVDRAIARVRADGTIAKVQFLINSPGGGVTGLPETADRIVRLGETKDTQAFIDGMGCSAAYWLASACHRVYATASSMSGSVGVYLALLDQSRWLEDQGLKVETVKDGKLKAAGSPWKPLTEDERAHFQDMVNQIGSLFRQAVTSRRPDIREDSMQGQAFFGTAALDAGLVDAIVEDRADALAGF